MHYELEDDCNDDPADNGDRVLPGGTEFCDDSNTATINRRGGCAETESDDDGDGYVERFNHVDTCGLAVPSQSMRIA